MALSNTTSQILSTIYNDDFYVKSNTNPTLYRGDEFDFQRILFRPKFGVQSRELTQLQTLIQNQMARFGQSAFHDGEIVYGAQLTLDTSVTSGRVLPTTNLVALFDRTSNTGKYVFNTNNPGTKAHVLQFSAADESGGTDNYLVYKYQSADQFAPGTVVQSSDDAQITATFAAGANADIFADGSIISIDEGVLFVSGLFVRVEQQTIVLNPFTSTPSFKIGLEVAEQIIDELNDTYGDTLLDPANQNAPGAHRLRLQLTLAKRTLNAPADPYFIELARVIDGVLQQIKQTPRFVRIDELMAILARRTYEESGDYIVRDFTPVISKDPTAEDHFLLTLGPGKAYVQGFEALTTTPTKLSLRKGRATESANNRDIQTRVGNFVYATRVAASTPLTYLSNTAIVDLHCVNCVGIDTTSNTTYFNSHIGQAKVRMLETVTVPANTSLQANNSVYKLYFYDTQWDSITGNLTTSSASNSVITLQALIGRGLPNVNNAINGATIVLSGALSPVTGTFTVASYQANTTVAQIVLKEFVPTLPNANTVYNILFQQKDIDAFALYDVTLTGTLAPYISKLKFQADVDATGKDSGTPLGNTVVTDTNNNGLLFQIPEQFVKANTITSNTATWSSWVKTTSNATLMAAANQNFTITVSGTGFTLPVGSLSAAAAQRQLLIFDQTADANGRGRILQFADTPGAGRCISNVSIGQVGQNYNISFTVFNSDSGTTRSMVGLARTIIVGLDPRQKTLMLGNTGAVYTGTANALNQGQIEFYSLGATANSPYYLKTADVTNIRKILYKDANTAFANSDLTSATDVTALFTLDTGQRDNSYEYSSILPTASASGTIKPTGRLLVIFDWFQHTGRGYVSLDSYLSSTNLGRGMTYDTIPSYVSNKFNNGSISLRDVLDFRPTRSNFDFLTNSMQFAANDTSSNTTYLTAIGEPYLTPTSDSQWLGNYQYYLSRFDKIGLGFDGVFHVIEGKDAVTAVPPTDDSGNLLMFQVFVPPYTLVDANGTPTGTSLTTFDHKRFTMQDISKIEDRVAHLEYYTALNSLETITKDQSIQDASGNERFKNGIVVDSFHGGDVGDITKSDFTASIDQQNRELRSGFRTFNMQFAADLVNSTSFGVSVLGDMAIPSFNTSAFITQGLATHAISVNPFDVASFYGKVTLSPAVDIWKDVDTKPAQVIDLGGPSESWVNANLPSYTVWGEWDQTWSGVVASTTQRQFFTIPGEINGLHPFLSTGVTSWDDVTTQTNYQRQGTSYEYTVTPTTASIGNFVVDVSVVHQMRKRDIVFAADGIKPQSNVYAFFDDTAVQNYVQQANILQLVELNNATTPPFYVGQTVYVQKAVSGTLATTNNSTTATGANSFFSFEIAKGQCVRITQGVNTFDRYVTSVDSNTQVQLSSPAPITLAAATMYTLVPVTVADVAPRYSGNNVQYTLKIVRATRDADLDTAVPYPMTPGSLRVEKQVNDSSNTNTVGATLLVPNSPRSVASSINIVSSLCRSGMVRSWNSGTAQLRFDLDIDNNSVAIANTTVYFVSGPGAGQSAHILSYNAATQTATLDTSNLNVLAEETIYSVGTPKCDGLITGNTAQGRAGTVAGVFHLQSSSFAVGTRNFRLTDSSTNDVQDATTTAETSYEASGISYTQQETSVSTRQLGVVRQGPTSESFTVDTTTRQNIQTQYLDPLAETFLIDAKQYPQGVFITSVDLCFSATPTDDIPVILELRPVVNGYPDSRNLVPCVSGEGVAQVALRPDQVRTTQVPTFDTSIGSPVSTRFTFTAPVHLLSGQEYAIVVRSDSDQYLIYTAELGKTVIGSTTIVAKQPYAGSFFKSQNASTWTESPFEDLMFQLNRAVWNASEATPLITILVTRGIAPTSNTRFDSLEFYPHDAQFSDSTTTTYNLDITPMNPATGDLTGQVAIRYGVVPNQWGTLVRRSLLQGSGGNIASNNISESARPLPFSGTRSIGPANTVDASITFTTWSPDVAPYVDMKKMALLAIRHEINDMRLYGNTVVIVNPGHGYLANAQVGKVTTTSTSNVVTGDANTNFTTQVANGDTLLISGSPDFEVTVATVTNSSQVILTANAGQSRSANTWTRYGGIAANNFVPIVITGGNGDGLANGYARVSSANGSITSVSITTNGSGYTATPTITVNATPTGIANVAANLVFTSELSPKGGNALTRYMTRSVTLADGFDARDLTVYFDAFRPAGSHFYVYYKVLPGDADSTRFDDQPWRPMKQVTADTVISSTYNQFKEFQFTTPNVRALDASTDTTDKFKIFSVKVVMATSNTVNAPRLTNFRAIALDS